MKLIFGLFTVLLLVLTIALQEPIAKVFSNAQDPLKPDQLSGKYDPNAGSAFFHGHKEEPVLIAGNIDDQTDVLGKSKKKKSSGEKRIEVDLSKQTLYTYEGSKKIHSYLISSGKWYPTPTGAYKIWTKLRYTVMSGGSKALNTYYYLPNVPYVMYFYGGYGIHGTYWHSNFGHPMSHGCVNMRTDQAGEVFNWADVGTKVVIYGKAPNN